MAKNFLRFDDDVPDVNYIVTSLPDYVKENTDILVDAIQFGSPTIRRITPQTGIKTTGMVNVLAVNVPFQNGVGCCKEPSGSAEISARAIVTGMIAKIIDICPDSLLGKWPEYLVRVPADDRKELPFEEYLIAALIAETEEQLEKAIWQGDTTSLDANLAQFDGFLKILAGEADVVAASVTSGASCFATLATVIAAIPAKVLGMRPKIFVAPEFFTQFSLELVEKNLYHFAPDGDLESIIFPGTRIEVLNTPGLEGTDTIVASPLDNMFYGTDVEDAHRRFRIVYDEKCESFRVMFRWNSGVQVAFPDRVVVAELAADPVSPQADAALAAIAAGVSELADADHIYKTDEQA